MFNKVDILKIFFRDPQKKYHLREIAKIFRISPRTAKNHLTQLCKEGLVIVEKEKIYENYRANLDSQKFKDYKVFYSIGKIRESGLIEYLNDVFNYPTIILFGSIARGEDIEKSDIDLFIITENKKDIDMSKFEKKLKKNIQIFMANKKEFKLGKNKELFNNVINGIILSGFVEVF